MMGTRRGGANVSYAYLRSALFRCAWYEKPACETFSVKTIPIIVALFSLSLKKIYLKPKNQHKVLLESARPESARVDDP